MRRLVFVLLVLPLFTTGCALFGGQGSLQPMQTIGEARILYLEEVDPRELPVPGVPWSNRVLDVEAERPLPDPTGAQTPGAALAGALLSAEDEVRLKVGTQLRSLPATRTDNLESFVARAPSVQRAIGEALGQAAIERDVNWPGRVARVRMSVELEDIARELADAGGGLRAGDGLGGVSRAELDRRAEQEAQRAALKDANEQLAAMFSRLEVEDGLTIGEAAQRDRLIAATLELAANTAPVLTSERAGGGQWRIVIEGDPEPLVKEVKLLLKESREERGR